MPTNEKKTIRLHIKDMPIELHQQCKIEAAKEGIPLYRWIFKVLKAYLARERKLRR